MKTAMLAGLLWALALACVPARAQDAAPALRVRAAIQDAARIAPGATVPLQLDVLTSTWFTQPPQLPALSLPGVMVTSATGEGAILHETIDGVAYSGLRYTYLLSPAAAGTVTVPPLRVSAKVGPGQRDAAGASQPLSFEVTATPATAGGAAAPAPTPEVSQAFSLAPDPAVVGGRITRSVTQRAMGVQPMMLPPAPLRDVPGFKRYPHEPEVTTLTDGRGGFLGEQRVDRSDYEPLAAGEAALPALSWNSPDASGAGGAQARLPGRSFQVGAAPAAAPPFSLADDLAHLRQGLRWVIPAAWLHAAAAVIALALLAWSARYPLRRLATAARARLRAARARYRAGERYAWRQWRRAPGDAAAGLTAFYRWLGLAAHSPDLRGALRAAQASQRDAGNALLEATYGPQRQGAAPRAQWLALSRGWRRAWRAAAAHPAPHALPRHLNPRQDGASATGRGPARSNP